MLEDATMKFIKEYAECGKEEFLTALKDSENTNKKVHFDEKRGKPTMFVKEKGNSIKITCKYIGGNTRDNGFIVGTYFIGKIKEKDGVSTLSGVVWTAPIFHFLMLAMLVVFIIQCIYMKGFSVVPFCLLAFDLVMFWPEFGKQGIIKRYIARARKRAENKKIKIIGE